MGKHSAPGGGCLGITITGVIMAALAVILPARGRHARRARHAK